MTLSQRSRFDQWAATRVDLRELGGPAAVTLPVEKPCEHLDLVRWVFARQGRPSRDSDPTLSPEWRSRCRINLASLQRCTFATLQACN
jgi:hypothetical protein